MSKVTRDMSNGQLRAYARSQDEISRRPSETITDFIEADKAMTNAPTGWPLLILNPESGKGLYTVKKTPAGKFTAYSWADEMTHCGTHQFIFDLIFNPGAEPLDF